MQPSESSKEHLEVNKLGEYFFPLYTKLQWNWIWNKIIKLTDMYDDTEMFPKYAILKTQYDFFYP